MTDQAQVLRKSILKDTIGPIDQSAAVVLLGVLFDYRIVLSRRISKLVQQYNTTFELDPLEPQSAAELVATLYGFDPDQLFLAFQDDWASMKTSPLVGLFVEKISSHQDVDRLEPWEVTP